MQKKYFAICYLLDVVQLVVSKLDIRTYRKDGSIALNSRNNNILNRRRSRRGADAYKTLRKSHKKIQRKRWLKLQPDIPLLPPNMCMPEMLLLFARDNDNTVSTVDSSIV